jgi:hypothetical protein
MNPEYIFNGKESHRQQKLRVTSGRCWDKREHEETEVKLDGRNKEGHERKKPKGRPMGR